MTGLLSRIGLIKDHPLFSGYPASFSHKLFSLVWRHKDELKLYASP